MISSTDTRMNIYISVLTITGLLWVHTMPMSNLWRQREKNLFPLNNLKKLIWETLGSSYTKTLDKSLEKNPDSFIVYKPYTKHEFFKYDGKGEHKADVIDMKYKDSLTDKYLTFISTGGSTWSVIRTEVNNGKKLLIIKDSFGNAIAPFMLSHYEEIYIVDARFYNKNVTGKNIIEFIEDNKIDEVLFCIYMEDVNWHKFMSGVEGLLN